MAYPAFRTLPADTTTSFEDLAKIKSGQRFPLRGYEYEACGDAVSTIRNGFGIVMIDAKRRHSAMPSGWELATVMEHRYA